MPKTTRGSALGIIVARAKRLAPPEYNYDRSLVAAILLDVHERVCPLQLTELARARDFDLAHDVFGILRHYRRSTRDGPPYLTDCFQPRYAVRQ